MTRTNPKGFIFIGCVALLLLQACTPADPDCASDKVFCIGLVTNTGGIDDNSLNQAAWQGIQQMQNESGTHVEYIESIDSKDYDKNIAAFAVEDYDVIITVGSGMLKATLKAAGLFPRINFIGVDQFQMEETPGFVGLIFPEDQAGFLAGALAAMMSNTHKIGAVCASDGIPPIWRLGEGYKAGAAHADDITGNNTEVFIAYHDFGSEAFTDPEWGAAIASSMISQGADTIFGCGGATGEGAVSSAAEADVYAIGVDTDQYLTLPSAAPRILTSAMKLVTPSLVELIRLARQGRLPDGNYPGNVGLALFHELENEVPTEVKARLDDIKAGLADGSVRTNVPAMKP